MLCLKKPAKLISGCCGVKSHEKSALLLGMALGATAAVVLCMSDKVKKKMNKMKKAVKNACGCSDNCDCGDSCDCGDDCDCDDDGFCCCDHTTSPIADNYECCRNDMGCSGDVWENDTLHSCGAVSGYPHDNYYGFADSKGDRPNDLSNSQISNDKTTEEIRNDKKKNNPQPENKVNEVK